MSAPQNLASLIGDPVARCARPPPPRPGDADSIMAGHRPGSIVAQNLRTTITRKRNPPAASPSCRQQPMRVAAEPPMRRPAGANRSRRSSAAPPDCRRSRARGIAATKVNGAVSHHEFTKRSLNMTANCVFTSAHSRGGRFHSALSVTGITEVLRRRPHARRLPDVVRWKMPLVRTARRSFEFKASMGIRNRYEDRGARSPG